MINLYSFTQALLHHISTYIHIAYSTSLLLARNDEKKITQPKCIICWMDAAKP